MSRKTPLCRKCGMPMKGHSRSGCRITNSPEQEGDGVSMISSTPFVIPETGPFRRRNPNYVPPPHSQMEPLVLSSTSLTTTEPVCSANTTRRNNIPSFQQQFTPNWSRPSSPQPYHRVPKQQLPFGLKSVDALHPDSVFGVQPDDSVKLVAGIYQVPSTTIESVRTRTLSNGLYWVPLNLPKKEGENMQNVDLTTSTWIITGPEPSDVDALAAILQPRGLFSQIRLTEIVQMVRNMDALDSRTLLKLLFISILLFIAFLR